MAKWTLDDIPWHEFSPEKLTPEIASLVKAACMVEHNSHDYARYLCEVFPDDEEFKRNAKEWASEEVQHGVVLKRWAELADPEFNFNGRFSQFTQGYKLPHVSRSVRGSRTGELIARCVVEVGTSSYYTAIANATNEPVLRAICRHIAADELSHYKLFYTHLKRYQQRENIGMLTRLRVALGRIGESGDDELAYAFYAASNDNEPYDRNRCKNGYLAKALALYQPQHVERMTAMVLKAVGLTPNGRLQRFASRVAWLLLVSRRRKAARCVVPVKN